MPMPSNPPVDNPTLTRDQFEFILAGVETNYQAAFEAAKGLAILKCDARDIARQRRMNQMVENQVIQLEEMFNIVIAVERTESRNRVPFPPRVIRDISIRNYRNGVGRTDGSRPADWESVPAV